MEQRARDAAQQDHYHDEGHPTETFTVTGNTATLSADHDGLTFAYAAGINRNNATAWVCSPLGRAELDITGYGTIASTAAAFRFGHWSTASTTGRSSYLFGYGSGASTELDAAAQTAFVAKLNQGL